MPRVIPPHLHRHAPKREDFDSQEDFEEAQAHFRHRFPKVPERLIPSLYKGSRSE